MAFNSALRTKVLLWCDRHCCLCKKACGVNIEVHHIVPEPEGGSDDIDNAMPLCFDCHSAVRSYDPSHPRGTKFKVEELKARREQVYETFTRHLVPPVHYELTQNLAGGRSRQFPDVGFVISHLGDSLPVHVRVVIDAVPRDKKFELGPGYYTGHKLWRLNPRFVITGHFQIPESYRGTDKQLTLEVRASVIDQYQREHHNLPVGYTYVRDGNYWYVEP